MEVKVDIGDKEDEDESIEIKDLGVEKEKIHRLERGVVLEESEVRKKVSDGKY